MLHPRFFADDDDIEEMLSSMYDDDMLDSATHIGAGVMITADNTGRTLFVRRGKGGDQAGTWAFPGGAVEPGETPQMAARREVQEEVGYDVGDAITALDRRDTGGVDFTTYGHDADVEFRPHLNDEHDAYKWVYIEDAPEPLHPGVAATLDNWDLTRDEASWNEEDHPRDKDGKFAFAAANADTSAKVHEVNQDLLKKGFAHGHEWSHYAPGEHGHSSLNEVHSFEVQKLAAGSFHNSLAKHGLAATEVKPLSGKDFTMYAVGEPKATAPHEAAPPPVVEHPLAKHLPSVQGKSTERVALRKQMDSAKGDELKQLQAKHNASFWKEHQALTKAGKVEKADEISKKLDNYSKKYGISNPLKQTSVSPATKAKAAAMVEKAATEFSVKVNAPAPEAAHSASGKIDSPTEAATLAKVLKNTGSPSLVHYPAEGKEGAANQTSHSYAVTNYPEYEKMLGTLKKGGYETNTYTANNGEGKVFGIMVPVGYKVVPAPKTEEASNTNKTKKLDINKPSDNFEQMLKNEGVEYGSSVDKQGTLFNITKASQGDLVATAAKYHPDAQKLNKFEYYLPHEAGKSFEAPEPKVQAPHHEPIDFNSLHKVGEQKGSNPGGVYEDKSKGETGDHPQYYVKSMDEAHSKNELLASKLYALAGSKTLDYVPVKPNGDTHYVATKFEKLDKDNVSKLDATERKAAQNDFATHAWLANWDSAGTGGDNQGVKNGVVKTLDVGGSLEYRAKGTPKGDLFGKTVNEWDTLRTGSKNPDAVGLYGNMTKTQLQASAAKVNAIKPSDIVATVQSVYGQGAKSNELSQKLIARQQDLVAKAKALDTPAPEPEKSMKQLAQEAAAAPKAKTQEQLDIEAVQKVHGYVPSKTETDKINKQFNIDLQPAHLGAIRAYVGSAYNGLNAELRKVKGQSLDVVKYAKVLDAALAKMPVHTGYMQRGIHTDKGFKIFESYAKHVGEVVTEQQFTSGGTQHKLWGETTLHIEAKTAADISKLNSEGGGEVILRKGTHLYIKKANPKTHEIWAEEV